jgi:hypothetical protein
MTSTGALPAAEASAVSDEARLDLPDTDGPVPAYELWRERIRKRFE